MSAHLYLRLDMHQCYIVESSETTVKGLQNVSEETAPLPNVVLHLQAAVRPLVVNIWQKSAIPQVERKVTLVSQDFFNFFFALSVFKIPPACDTWTIQTIPFKLRQLQGRTHILLCVNKA